KQAISVFERLENQELLTITYINLGDLYFNENVLDSSLFYFERGRIICEHTGNHLHAAYNLGNIGLVQAKQGNHRLAEANITEATEILRDLGDLYPISVYLTYMADIYVEKGALERALQYAHESLKIGEELGLKEQIRDASLKLSELYELTGEIPKAYTYH